jgi:hypothetical protein
MIRHTLSIFIASAAAAGCTITTTPAGTDSGPGGDDASVAIEAAASSDDADGGAGASAPEAGVSVDAGGAGCAFGEPNDTRETATAIDLNHKYAGMCVSSDDGTMDTSDFYVVTAPGDVAGGYVTFTISNVSAMGLVEATATAAADGAPMVDVTPSGNGASITGWFTVSPGAKYRLEVKRYAGVPSQFTYDLELAYAKITDAYEPNNTRADAKTITAATPIQASAAAFSANGDLVTTDDDDWYAVTLAAGSATVTLSHAPADYYCDLQLFDPSVAPAGNHPTSSGPGSDCKLDATGLAAGTYTLDVHAYSLMTRAGTGAAPPSVTGSYTLAVTQ